MAFGIPDDVAIQVLVEETTGQEPGPETANVPEQYRLRIRRQVEAIRRAGGQIDIPAAFPDPDEEIIE